MFAQTQTGPAANRPVPLAPNNRTALLTLTRPFPLRSVTRQPVVSVH